MQEAQSKDLRGRSVARIAAQVRDVQDLIDYLTSLLKQSQYHRSDSIYVVHGNNHYEVNEVMMIDDRVLIGVSDAPTDAFGHEE